MVAGPRTPLRAVFFDAGGTLLKASPSVGHVYARVLARYGRHLDADRLELAFEQSWARANLGGRDRFSSHAGGSLGFWRFLLGEVLALVGEERPLSDQEFDAVYDEFCRGQSYQLFPETLSVLREVAARGLALGVISNWDGRLPQVLEGIGLTRYFSAVVVSGLEGHEKPAPEMFSRACARLGVEPSEALHVGDARHDDYDGARASGLAALLVDRQGCYEPGYDVIPDLTGVLRRLDALTQGG